MREREATSERVPLLLLLEDAFDVLLFDLDQLVVFQDTEVVEGDLPGLLSVGGVASSEAAGVGLVERRGLQFLRALQGRLASVFQDGVELDDFRKQVLELLEGLVQGLVHLGLEVPLDVAGVLELLPELLLHLRELVQEKLLRLVGQLILDDLVLVVLLLADFPAEVVIVHMLLRLALQ